MRNFFLLAMLFIANFAIGQSLKTYSGVYPYSPNSNIEGKATYTYREGELGERIYEGKFTFSVRILGTYTATGQFANNEKNGCWVYRSVSQISPATLTVNYKQGIHDGAYRYEEKNRKGIIERSLYVTFLNGHLVGDFKYKDGGDTYITGKYDDQGRKQGKWEFLDLGKRKYTFIFKDDDCSKSACQNVQTGDITNTDFDTVRRYWETHCWQVVDMEKMVRRGKHIDCGVSLDYNQESALQVNTSSYTNNNKIYDVVEEMPSFPGGQDELMTFLSKNIQYPIDAKESGVQGRVICTFVVENNGSITNVKVTKSVSTSLDNEAIRVIQNMPHWNPGKQNGSTVRTKFTLPVIFRL